jgi:glycerol-3-phosphate O-acyltransferase
VFTKNDSFLCTTKTLGPQVSKQTRMAKKALTKAEAEKARAVAEKARLVEAENAAKKAERAANKAEEENKKRLKRVLNDTTASAGLGVVIASVFGTVW